MPNTSIYLFPTDIFTRDELKVLLEDEMEKLYLTFALDSHPKVRKYTSLSDFTEDLNDQQIDVDNYWIYSFQHDTPSEPNPPLQWLLFRFDTAKEQTLYLAHSYDPHEMHDMEEFIKSIPGVSYHWKWQSENTTLENEVIKMSVCLTKDELYQKFTPLKDNADEPYWVTFSFSSIIGGHPSNYAVKCRDKKYASEIYTEVLSLSGIHNVKVGRKKDGISVAGHKIMSVGKFRTFSW